jgi:hypothetical protein
MDPLAFVGMGALVLLALLAMKRPEAPEPAGTVRMLPSGAVRGPEIIPQVLPLRLGEITLAFASAIPDIPGDDLYMTRSELERTMLLVQRSGDTRLAARLAIKLRDEELAGNLRPDPDRLLVTSIEGIRQYGVRRTEFLRAIESVRQSLARTTNETTRAFLTELIRRLGLKYTEAHAAGVLL